MKAPLLAGIGKSKSAEGGALEEYPENYNALDDGGADKSCSSDESGNAESSNEGGTSGVAGASFNLANGIVGSGIVGLPFAVQESGFILGMLSLFTVAYFTDYTVRVLVETGRAVGVTSYEKLCERAFGAKGFYFLTGFQVVNSFGACVSYMVLIAETVPVVFGRWLGPEYGDQTTVTIIACTFILLPLCLYRDMSHLEKWSLLSLVNVVAMVAAVIYEFCIEGKSAALYSQSTQELLLDVHPQVAPAIGTIAFAYGCQQYSFIIFNTLKNPTRKRWNRVSKIAVWSASGASILMALFGYFTFGKNIKGNMFDNFSDGNQVANAARIILSVTMFLTFPLDYFVIRYAAQRLIQRLGGKPGCSACSCLDASSSSEKGGVRRESVFTPAITAENLKGKGRAADLSTFQHLWFSVLLWGICLATAFLALQSGGNAGAFGLVLQLTGGLGSVFIAFVFPTACYIKLAAEWGDKGKDRFFKDVEGEPAPSILSRSTSGARAMAWGVLVFGAVSGSISFIQTCTQFK